jgi:hypothetical protein
MLAGMLVDEFKATYDGPDRIAYLKALGSGICDLGGVVEEGSGGAVVRFEGRRIAIRFGPVSGHR